MELIFRVCQNTHLVQVHAADAGDQARGGQPHAHARQVSGERRLQSREQPGDHDGPGRHRLHVARREWPEDKESESAAWAECRGDLHGVRRGLHQDLHGGQ